MRKKTWLACSLIMMMLCSVTAQAFHLKPISMKFSPEGELSTRSFVVENEHDKPIAVQVSIMTRETDIDGKETRQDANEKFLVYPSQMVLAPKASQVIRVSWRGDAEITQEQAYRIIGEQLPIDVDRASLDEEKPSARFDIIMKYIGALYITPPGASPELVIESTGFSDIEGERYLEIVFHNKGKAHSMLKGINMSVFSKETGKSIAISSKEIPAMEMTNLLAGAKRRFLVSWPDVIPYGEVSASFEIEPYDAG
jgi:fimbrial chaperone protein